MQRQINNDDFESFLQQSADQVRMHPSSAVWKNISKDLNKKRRRWVVIFASLLITVSTGGYFLWNDLNIPSTIYSNQATPSLSPVITIPDRTPDISRITKKTNTKIITVQNTIAQNTIAPNTPKKEFTSTSNNTIVPLLSAQPQFKERSIIIPEDLSVIKEDEEMPSLEKRSGAFNEVLALQRQEGSFNDLLAEKPKAALNSVPSLTEKDSTNLEKAEEVVINKKTRERKLTWQLFFSPNISYRKLSENKSFVRPVSTPGSTFNYFGLYDVNNAVIHKPDIGFEFGITSKYSVTKNIKLRAGFQFNINRYNIKAFSYVPEVATIALNNGYRVDLVNTISNYRNFNGGKTDWLKNFYFQASVPLGAEVKITGNNKMHVGIASSIQPTYIIGDRAYLITNDYKNYAEMPWLIRRWNVNTNLETFVSYSTGKTNWQIGPQVRYQLLSSFVSQYPVKENLFDFGLKIGVTLNQR